MTASTQPLPEPQAAEVARRLRAYMGERKISRQKLALASGVGRTPLGVKLDGKGEFTLTEIVDLSRALGRSWFWLLTGDETNDPPPPPGFGLPADGAGPDGTLLLPRVDSNHEPADECLGPYVAAAHAA